MTLPLSQARVRDLLGEMHQLTHCRRCRRTYTELENGGRWRCRRHPGLLREGAEPALFAARPAAPSALAHWRAAASVNRMRYACCNQPRGARGCTRCDHVSPLAVSPDGDSLDNERDLALPRVRAEQIYGVHRLRAAPGVAYDVRDEQYTVSRAQPAGF